MTDKQLVDLVGEVDDYDSPWKEALAAYFPECMRFFFPDAADDIGEVWV